MDHVQIKSTCIGRVHRLDVIAGAEMRMLLAPNNAVKCQTGSQIMKYMYFFF